MRPPACPDETPSRGPQVKFWEYTLTAPDDAEPGASPPAPCRARASSLLGRMFAKKSRETKGAKFGLGAHHHAPRLKKPPEIEPTAKGAPFTLPAAHSPQWPVWPFRGSTFPSPYQTLPHTHSPPFLHPAHPLPLRSSPRTPLLLNSLHRRPKDALRPPPAHAAHDGRRPLRPLLARRQAARRVAPRRHCQGAKRS